MPAETTIITPLPVDVTGQAVVDTLHDHALYIRTTCPQLISRKHMSGTPGLSQPCVYEITDKRPIGRTTFKMTLRNVAGGVDTVVEGRTPTGSMIIRSQWRVRARKLEEVVEIDSNKITTKFIKRNIEKGHPELHSSFIAESAKA
ncbi:hypothetical protein HD806DRAFT_553133 [Xylariaceae sp. AK1471]|nr:hypothetical protein HD806DRAFT_553133 [Xylariaceae sp. AK1471]